MDGADPRGPGPDKGANDRQVATPQVEERAALAHVEPGPSGERRVVLVDPDRDAELRPRPLGEAYVVEVGVREHERLDVAGGASEPPQGPEQGLPGGRQAGVDDGDAAALLHEVPVDEVLADPVHAFHYVAVQHRCLLSPRALVGIRLAGGQTSSGARGVSAVNLAWGGRSVPSQASAVVSSRWSTTSSSDPRLS